MSKKVIRTALSMLVFAAVVTLAVWYIRGHTEEFKRILEIDLRSAIMLSALCIVAILLSGLQMNAIVSIFGTRFT